MKSAQSSTRVPSKKNMALTSSNSSLISEMDLLTAKFPNCVADVSSKEFSVADINEHYLKQGIRTLKGIMSDFRMRDLRREQRSVLLNCSLYSMYYHWDKQDLANTKRVKCVDTYTESIKCYKSVVNYLSEGPEELVEHTISFIEQFNLWKYCTYASNVFRVFVEMGINKIYPKFTNVIINTKTKHCRQNILRVLYSIVKYVDTKKQLSLELSSILHTMTIKFLEVFLSNLNNPHRANNLPISALQAFLKRICQKVKKQTLFAVLSKLLIAAKSFNYDNVDLNTFGSFIEFAADLYKPEGFLELDVDKLFKNLLKLITSPNSDMSNIACLVFQHLLDRKKNKTKLKPLKIYFDFLKTDIEVSEMDERDVVFMDRHKLGIVSSMTSAISQHSDKKYLYDDWFCCIALISIEIPCGLTAAWTGWISMKIQEIGLKETLTDLPTRHSMHVLTISLLSLMSWVHKSQPLYDYVRKIAANRSGNAPHLNPPIRQHYDYPQYHITWDKPDLFFDEWELRYALWKTFGVLKTPPQVRGSDVVDSYLA